MHRTRCFPVLACFVLAITVATSAPIHAEDPPAEETPFAALEWRNVGPFRGGRSTTVTGVAQHPERFYFGSTGGGVWRSDDAGTTWRNISDGHFATGSVGAIAVAPSDPNVVYVGMGEAPVRGVMTTHGDGVYRSTDGGETWTHIGLEDSRHIARIRVHPREPDTLWVAIQGHLYGPNDQRGIYKSTDGGDTWRRTLFVDEDTGASDLAIDVVNPRILYAAMWQHRRRPWIVESGGPGSGLWKSTDGGETWNEATKGLPELMGKIGVAVSPVDPNRVWAIVEAEAGGLFRSDDRGVSWRLINEERVLRGRAWYYMHVFADTQNADVVYVLNAPMMKSIDGGRSFAPVSTPHGDNHDLWQHPDDARRMINANDGGANVSTNGGATWSTQNNQPTAQFYRVAVDNRFPYWLYGGQQDNTAIAIKSRSMGGAITDRDWHSIGGCESADPAFDPDDPRYVYAGCYQGIIDEYDMETEQIRSIMAYPFLGLGAVPSEMRYRFNWNAPIRVSPQDPATIYHAGNVMLRSRDRGRSWEEVSPDLTRDEEERQGPGGGPITKEGAGGEVYNTILSFETSPHDPGVLWAGTDDGRVHVTRDAGATWSDVSPAAVGEAMINAIEVSPHAPASAYLAVTRYKWDDLTPMIFATEDFGATWTARADGLPADTIVRVVREDPDRRGLLYAGTERGVFLSFDDGGAWQPLQLNLPVVPVTDLAVHRGDLIAATQGRAFWILDDLTPLHHWQDSSAEADLHLFAPRPTIRTGGGRGGRRAPAAAGVNPHNGVYFHYIVAAPPEDPDAEEATVSSDEGDVDSSEDSDGPPALELEIRDARDEVVRTVSSAPPEGQKGDGAAPSAGGPGNGPPRLTTKPGLNRFVWNLRGDPIPEIEGVLQFGDASGYRVGPGTYTAILRRGETEHTQTFEVLPDPRVNASPDDYADQAAMLREIRARIIAIHDGVNRMRDARSQVETLLGRLEDHEEADALRAAGDVATEAIDAWVGQLVQTESKTFQDVINFPNRLNAELFVLMGDVDSLEPIVNRGVRERFEDLDAVWQPLATEMQRILDEDLDTFNDLFEQHAIPAVIVEASTAE